METIAAYALDMSEFLNESELTERRAFIETFVKEIVVMPGDALLRYTVPMPDDSLIPGRATEKVALNGSVLSTVHDGGPTRTELSLSHKADISRGSMFCIPSFDEMTNLTSYFNHAIPAYAGIQTVSHLGGLDIGKKGTIRRFQNFICGWLALHYPRTV